MRKLGEKLFFDRSLSANGTLSCAMCHIPAQGFASNQSALSIGMEGRSLRRNAPSLYNVVFKKFLFHDGRETDLAAQVWGPLLAADEMGNGGIGPLIARLRADADYGPLFEAAFPGEGATMSTLGRAIAAYEASLLRGGGRFRSRGLWRRTRGADASGMARLQDFHRKSAVAPPAIRSDPRRRFSPTSPGTIPGSPFGPRRRAANGWCNSRPASSNMSTWRRSASH